MSLLKNRFVKLCTSEAISSECTNYNSVVWSSLCMFQHPDSSQELQDHLPCLAGVVPPPLWPHLVISTSWESSPRKVSASASCWLHCGSSPLSWGFKYLSVPRTGLRAGLRPELKSVPDIAGGGCQAVEKQLLSCPDTVWPAMRLCCYWVTRVPAAGGRKPESGAQPGPAGCPRGLLHANCILQCFCSSEAVVIACMLHLPSAPFCLFKGHDKCHRLLSYENLVMWLAEQTGCLPLFCTVSSCNGKLYMLRAWLLPPLV